MFKSDKLLENIAGPAAGNSHQIGQKTGPNTSEHFSLPQGGRSIHRHHLQNFLGRDGREFSLKRADLVKQAQALITRETVSAEANVQVKRTQTFELNAADTKVSITNRRLHRCFDEVNKACGARPQGCAWTAAIPRLRDRFESADVSAHCEEDFSDSIARSTISFGRFWARTSMSSPNHHVRIGAFICAINSGNAVRFAMVVVPNLLASVKPLLIEAR